MQRAAEGIQYVEALLKKQLATAVGKELSAEDFSNYMLTHGRRLFKPAFAPRPLCFAVRRSPLHSPEGTLRIEKSGTPILTIAAIIPTLATVPMEFAISAETRIRFGGERWLHAWLTHRFSTETLTNNLTLVGSARQFSSFILLVGRIGGPTLFEPVSAIIVKDKDEITDPLIVAELPTPKAFKDAIASLAPEQQSFAKAFRSMQLESTLFGVLILHIKPQLELILHLPADSLTKEVALTQDLMDLFIKYQIPADLLSYTGPLDATTSGRIAVVKDRVRTIKAMIAKAQEDSIHQRVKEKAFQQSTTIPATSSWDQENEDEVTLEYECSMKRMSKELQGCSMETSSKKSGSSPVDRVESFTVVATETVSRDITQVPSELDAMYELYDTDSTLHTNIISVKGLWSKSSQASLLTTAAKSMVTESEQKMAKSAAFDLLDALSRSGALIMEHAALHVVMGATHAFDNSLIDTVIQHNVNPIEKAERSLLIMATTLHQQPAVMLVQDNQQSRLAAITPALFLQ